MSSLNNSSQEPLPDWPEDRFDPSRFHLKDDVADPLIDAIPVDDEPMLLPPAKELFAIVPLGLAKHLPPPGRLLVLLLFLDRAAKPDCEGWHKLTSGRLDKVGITDRFQAYRAVAALEKAGVIKSNRRVGRSIRIQPAVPLQIAARGAPEGHRPKGRGT